MDNATQRKNVACLRVRSLSIFFLLTMATLDGNAQTVISLDSSSIAIGSQATLMVKNASSYPTLDALSQGDIEALTQRFDTSTATQYTTLTCFEEGEHWLHVTESDSILLTVRDVPNVDTASAEIRDIADIADEPYTFWEIFRWFLLAIGIAALIAAIVYVVKRIKAHKPIIEMPKAPPLPPDTRALKALEDLRQRQLWQQGLVKEYHTDLTDIVRAYLEEAHSIPSTDMTTDETLEAFTQQLKGIVPGQDYDTLYNMLGRMLRTADMVKFAKSEPLPYEHDQSMTDAVALIKTLATPPDNELGVKS